MNNAQQAYDVFNRLWSKIPRSVRLDRENHQLMLDIRRFFDGLLEVAKRSSIVGNAIAAGNKSADAAPGDVEGPDPIRQALRLLRTLDRREWEMVKSIVDLFHKFSTEDFLDVLDAARDASCPRCGEWLDDEDPHESCQVPPDDDEVDVAPANAASNAAPANAAPANAAPVVPAVTPPPHPAVPVTPPVHVPLYPTESEPKVGPGE